MKNSVLKCALWGAGSLVMLLLARSAGAAPPGDRGIGQDITFPETLLVQNGGPVINVQHPPAGIRAAKGDNVTDDTEALRDVYDFLKTEFVKHKHWDPPHYYVYLPNGIYKVSDTIIYRGPTVGSTDWGKDQAFDINRIHIVGQSRTKTALRLTDHAPGYQDADKPRIVLAFQHPDNAFNNVPGSNWLRNLTIDTGRGNPGAAALYFQGANNTDLRGVTIRSGDGAGKYGIWFKTGSVQGYYADVTVVGFDYGIFDPVNPEGDPAFEYLTLKNQRLAGILHTGGGLSLRKVFSDQSAHGVPSLLIDGSGAQTVLLDSVLKGSKNSPHPAIEMTRGERQCLFARTVQTPGYALAVRKAGAAVVPGKIIDEYVSYPVKSLREGQSLRSLRLPVADTPIVPWYDPATQWAIVDDYPGVQAALDSGKPVICFKKRAYRIPGDVRVPASVKVINGLGAGVEGGAFLVDKASSAPLLFQDTGMPIRILAQRTVIQRCAGGGIANPNGLPVTVFLENTNDNATGDDFCRPGQKVYARQIDIEYGGGQQLVVNGGHLWIFGYKTENGAATPFTVKNRGWLEILGGYGNATNMPPCEKQNPYLRVIDGSISATLFLNLGTPFCSAVLETRAGVTKTLHDTDLPKRGTYGGDYVMPLYVSYEKPPAVR